MASTEDDVTFVPLSINSTPGHPTPVSFDGPPPPGYSQKDLDTLNHLAHVLLLNPNIPFPPPPQAGPNPRSMQINKYKEEGNTFFKTGRFREAVHLYSQAAFVASSRPLLESNLYIRDELSIVLCNRSAAYGMLGEWTEALVDAESVLTLKRPWVKGHFRKGKALAGLGRFEEAREALLLGLQFDPSSEELAQAVGETEKEMKDRDDKLRLTTN